MGTALLVKKFFGMTTAEMRREYSPLSPAEKLEFCDMLPAGGLHPNDREKRLAAVA